MRKSSALTRHALSSVHHGEAASSPAVTVMTRGVLTGGTVQQATVC